MADATPAWFLKEKCMKVAESVYEKILPLFANTGIRLIEVEYIKKNDGMHLIVYIDRDEGLTLDDCVFVNDLIDEALDELNPTDDKPYALDISSYGLDRPLKYDWQFDKYMNKMVTVKLYRKIGDLKEFDAVLVNYTDKDYTFDINNRLQTISATDVAYITPYIEF